MTTATPISTCDQYEQIEDWLERAANYTGGYTFETPFEGRARRLLDQLAPMAFTGYAVTDFPCFCEGCWQLFWQIQEISEHLIEQSGADHFGFPDLENLEWMVNR